MSYKKGYYPTTYFCYFIDVTCFNGTRVFKHVWLQFLNTTFCSKKNGVQEKYSEHFFEV